MTYGAFLEHCRFLAGSKTKSDFSRLLGLKNPDHLIRLTNDRYDGTPSLDLLERAARAAGAEFQDYIQIPEKQKIKKVSKEYEKAVRQLTDVYEMGGKAAEFLLFVLSIVHVSYVKKVKNLEHSNHQ